MEIKQKQEESKIPSINQKQFSNLKKYTQEDVYDRLYGNKLKKQLQQS